MSHRLLICDLDNTLYDWVSFYAQSFLAFVDGLVATTGIEREELLDDFRAVHRRHQNSEHPFAVLELECIRRRFAGMSNEDILSELDEAMHAFNSTRKRTLLPYDGVRETLAELVSCGVQIVAHTEAIAELAFDRLRRLELTQFFSCLYARDSTLPPHPRSGPMNPAPEGFVERIPIIERKPNPALLDRICRRHGMLLCEAVYVGDSLTKDMGMAKTAGAYAVWARYGTRYDRHQWSALVRITHWTPEDVEQEKRLKEKFLGVEPDLVIDSFSQLLGAFPGIRR